MSETEYTSPGSYTTDDTTGYYKIIETEGVTLSDTNNGGVVLLSDQDTVIAAGSGIIVIGDYFAIDADTVTLNGVNTVFEGTIGAATVAANGVGSRVYGTSDDGSAVSLNGANELYTGASGKATINIILKNAANSTVVGGSGGDTLSLTSTSLDTSPIVIDVGRNTASGTNGITFKNIANINYHIANPGNSARFGANTTFTTESGTNTFDFSYSSGTNTVFNTGGSDTVSGGSGTDVAVGGTGLTRLGTSGGADYLYAGGVGSTNVLQPSNGTGGTDRFYGGAGTDYFFGSTGNGNEYFYGGTGTESFTGGGGNDVLVEGTGTNTFTGTTGMDFVYGSSGASKVFGGSGSDFVYTGTQAQYFDSGTGKEYFEEMQGSQSNGKLDVVDNFQTQSAGGKGTYVFLPSYEANSTSFVQGQGGVYVQTDLGSGHTSSILVANTNNLAAVKAQTFFNL